MLAAVAYRKTTLIDFPGRVAAALFLPGCNFRCPYCHNAPLVEAGRDASSGEGGAAGLSPLEEFWAFLDRRRSLLSGLVISGGEPLAHDETPTIAAATRERGLAVKLDTNGYFPERIDAVAADYIALDFKTAPSVYERVAPSLPDAAERVLESLRRLRASGREFEVRITCAPGIVGPEELDEMLGFLEPADALVLQPFRPGGCLDPKWNLRAPYDDLEMRQLLKAARGRVAAARIRGAA